MADTRYFSSPVQVPVVDYGAIYEQAKARREADEERKLQYLNQFQKERGAFAPGVYSEVNSMFDQLQKDLDTGDMSFEAKKRRMMMYNNYKDAAAVALEWSNKLNDAEATILANPSLYNNPELLLEKITEDRTRQIPLAELEGELRSYPSLNTFRRYQMQEMSPNSAASTILQNLKAGGGIQDLYDMDATGGIQDDVLISTVSDFLSTNGMSREEEDAAISFILRKKGVLTGSASDYAKVSGLSDEDRIRHLSDYANYTATALRSMIADDIETQKEEEAARLRMARAEANIKAGLEQQAAQANAFSISAGPVTYMPPIEANERGQFVLTSDNQPITDDRFVMSAKVTDTQPSYVDVDGTKKYVEQLAVDRNGNQYVMVRFDQDVIDAGTGRATSTPVRSMVPWAEVIQGAGSGLSNMKQAAKIQATFNRMGVPVSQPQTGGQASALDALMKYTSDAIAAQEATKQQPEPASQVLPAPVTTNIFGEQQQEIPSFGQTMSGLISGVRGFFGGSPATKQSGTKAFQSTSNSGTKRIGQ